MEKFLIDGFNEACKNIDACSLKVGDESMSAIRFWTTEKGNLPYRKGSTKDYFIFDSWLSKNKAEVSVMEVCADLIGMEKKNCKGLYKETIENL